MGALSNGNVSMFEALLETRVVKLDIYVGSNEGWVSMKGLISSQGHRCWVSAAQSLCVGSTKWRFYFCDALRVFYFYPESIVFLPGANHLYIPPFMEFHR